jgi:hypothetical protein
MRLCNITWVLPTSSKRGYAESIACYECCIVSQKLSTTALRHFYSNCTLCRNVRSCRSTFVRGSEASSVGAPKVLRWGCRRCFGGCAEASSTKASLFLFLARHYFFFLSLFSIRGMRQLITCELLLQFVGMLRRCYECCIAIDFLSNHVLASKPVRVLPCVCVSRVYCVDIL